MARTREETERLRAKAERKSHQEERRQREYQDLATEELRRRLMKPRWDGAALSPTQCQSEVERLKAQMRQQVEQLQPRLALELSVEEEKVAQEQEEREQVTAGDALLPAPLA